MYPSVLLFSGLESFTKILHSIKSAGGGLWLLTGKANMMVVQIVTVTFCKAVCPQQWLLFTIWFLLLKSEVLKRLKVISLIHLGCICRNK